MGVNDAGAQRGFAEIVPKVAPGMESKMKGSQKETMTDFSGHGGASHSRHAQNLSLE